MRKEYTSDTINQIWADVQEVQESGIGRKILPKDLDYAAKRIESQPYGEIIRASAGKPRNLIPGMKAQFFKKSWRRLKL